MSTEPGGSARKALLDAIEASAARHGTPREAVERQLADARRLTEAEARLRLKRQRIASGRAPRAGAGEP